MGLLPHLGFADLAHVPHLWTVHGPHFCDYAPAYRPDVIVPVLAFGRMYRRLHVPRRYAMLALHVLHSITAGEFVQAGTVTKVQLYSLAVCVDIPSYHVVIGCMYRLIAFLAFLHITITVYHYINVSLYP